MSSEDLHIPREALSAEARLLHYAITSLREELDAVDWYRQRVDDSEDPELREILLHNMREEMEHACMDAAPEPGVRAVPAHLSLHHCAHNRGRGGGGKQGLSGPRANRTLG